MWVNHSFSFDTSVVLVAEMSGSLKTCAIKSISSSEGRRAIAFKSHLELGTYRSPGCRLLRGKRNSASERMAAAECHQTSGGTGEEESS